MYFERKPMGVLLWLVLADVDPIMALGWLFPVKWNALRHRLFEDLHFGRSLVYLMCLNKSLLEELPFGPLCFVGVLGVFAANDLFAMQLGPQLLLLEEGQRAFDCKYYVLIEFSVFFAAPALLIYFRVKESQRQRLFVCSTMVIIALLAELSVRAISGKLRETVAFHVLPMALHVSFFLVMRQLHNERDTSFVRRFDELGADPDDDRKLSWFNC
jgi:hypothetical protein